MNQGLLLGRQKEKQFGARMTRFFPPQDRLTRALGADVQNKFVERSEARAEHTGIHL